MKVFFKIICFFLLLQPLFSDEIPCPSPFCLEPNFWNYFESQDKGIETKIADAIEELKKFEFQASEETIQETRPFVNQITLNLKALPELQKLKIEMPEPKIFEKKYAISDFLNLASKHHDISKTVAEEEKELKEETRKNIKLANQIDALMASYIKLSERTNERFLQGLKIYALKSNYALEKEKERLLKSKFESLKEMESTLRLELDHALKNLAISESEKQIRKKMEEERQKLSRAELASLNSAIAVSSKFSEGLENEIALETHQHSAIAHQIDEAFIKLKLLQLKAELFLKKWSDKKRESLEEKLSLWNTELKEMESSLASWQAKTENTLQGLLHHSFNNTVFDNPKTEIEKSSETYALYDAAQKNFLNLNKIKGELAGFSNLSDHMERILYEESPFFHFFYALKDTYYDLAQKTDKFLSQSLFKIGDIPITISSLLQSLLIILVAAFISFVLRKALKRFLTHKEMISLSSLFIVDRCVHYLIILIATAIALASLGLNFSSLVLVLGALSVGIGFGLQMIVNNFVSSLIILFSRNIKVHDYIQLSSGEWGQVTDINIQNTIIRTSDGIEVVVPNSELIAQKFVNWTMKDPYKRLHIPFGVAYGTDKELVKKAAVEAALKEPATISNHPMLDNPKVILNNFGENALEFELVVWVNLLNAKSSYGSIYSGYRWHLDDALAKYGITIPFPQRDLRLYPVSASIDSNYLK